MMQDLVVRLTKVEGSLMGQCASNRAVLVTEKNRGEVKANLRTCVAGHVEAFPRAERQLFSGGKMKKVVLVEAT